MSDRRFEHSRRRFLGSLFALASCGLLGCSLRSLRTTTEGEAAQQRTLDLLDRYHAFDLHTHPGVFPLRGGSSPGFSYAGDEGVAKTVSEMLNGHLSGGFFSLVADFKILEIGPNGVRASRAFEGGEAWADYQRQIAELKDLLEALPAELATQAADLEALQERGRVAAFVGCEGGDCLEGQPERLERMYLDGVRSLQLIHYTQNELGDLQTEEPLHNGLSEVGREVVQEMNRIGMLIDVAHASSTTVSDIANVSDAPIILSHSQLKWGDKQHPRLLDADQAKIIADTGGVIGMWPSGFGNETFADFVDNTLRMVELVGVDHVGLGTDMDANYMPVFDTYLQLPDWTEALLAKGLSKPEVGKLVGGNAFSVLGQVLT